MEFGMVLTKVTCDSNYVCAYSIVNTPYSNATWLFEGDIHPSGSPKAVAECPEGLCHSVFGYMPSLSDQQRMVWTCQ